MRPLVATVIVLKISGRTSSELNDSLIASSAALHDRAENVAIIASGMCSLDLYTEARKDHLAERSAVEL